MEIPGEPPKHMNLEKNEQLVMAIELAVKAHGTTPDKAGVPYILHPLHVMNSVEGLDAKIVAVLHDVVEDTEVEIAVLNDEELRYLQYGIEIYEFPAHIIDAIDAITKRDGEKNVEYWARVKANPLALQVKLADIKHNLSRLDALSPDEKAYLRDKYGRAMQFFLSQD